MRRCIRVQGALLGLALCLAAARGTPAPNGEAVLLESFEDEARLERWSFWHGPEFPGAQGSFRRSTDAAHAGRACGALAFDFTGGGNYVQASVPMPAGPPATHVRLWIRKATPHRLTVRVTDSEGQTFQKGFHVPYTGWQEVRVSLSGWTGFWGGQGDGVFRGTPASFGVLVENTALQRTGVVYLDEIRVISTADQPPAPEAEYVVSRFGAGERWWLSASGQAGESALHEGTLRCDFAKGATSVGLATDLALMGQPQRLLLRVRSRAAGHRVRVCFGSHFQGFEKVLGTLDGSGEQVLEAPLGDMKEWTHGGGEDDGVARLPLRLTYVGVERADGGQTAEVQLLDLRVRTRISPEDAVVLVPDRRLEGGRATFSCEVRSLRPDAAEGALEWTIRDYAGSVVSRGEHPLPLGAGETARHAIGQAMGKRAFLECELRYRAGGRTYGPAKVAAVAPLAGGGDPVLRPESPFGMGLYLYRYPGDPPGLAQMDRAAALAQAAGVKWSREEMLWHRIEPEKGRFDWSYYDKVVETAHRHGISIYGLIDYWSEWTKPYTREGIEDYARYCTALVSHYKGRIKHWEIWNEPNIFFWSGPKELYPELLKAAYRAIREADPEAQVLGCSTAGIDHGFIEQVMRAGAPFDVLTVHPYRWELDDAGFIGELQETAALAGKADGKPKPVWITEMGWSTQLGGGISEREQAQLLARCYLCAVASGAAPNISWYDFREDGPNRFYNEHCLGVVRSDDLSPKPAYRALATVCRTLAGQAVKGKLETGPGVLAYRFAGGGKETVVIWSPARDALCVLRGSGKGIHARSLMGERVPLAWNAGRALLSLPAGSPVFLTGGRALSAVEPAPVAVEAPASAHPGARVRVACRASGSFAGMVPDLEAPQGWQASRAAGGQAFEVTVPADARPGAAELALVLRRGRQAIRLPIRLEVLPLLLDT